MNRSVADVFSINPYLDPYQMRRLNKEYAFSTQKRFCEAPVTLREVLNLSTTFYALIKVKDTIGIWRYNGQYENDFYPEDVIDSEGYWVALYSGSMETIRYYLSRNKHTEFVRFDLASVRQILLNRGCDEELVKELVLADLKSAREEIESKQIFKTYINRSLYMLGKRGNYEDVDYDNPEEIVAGLLYKE